MRKRFISDITWKSRKVREIQPPEWRSEYAWLIPMVEDTGVFEFDPERIYADAYATARPDWSLEKLCALLEELIRVRLIYRWTDEETGKVMGFWVGSDKPGMGLLPKPSERYCRLPLPEPADMTRFLGGQSAEDPLEAREKSLSGFSSSSRSRLQQENKPAGSRTKAFEISD